jgi:translation initiation factor 2B subunit (eIF-2B alpha/beta/delta family)
MPLPLDRGPLRGDRHGLAAADSPPGAAGEQPGDAARSSSPDDPLTAALARVQADRTHGASWLAREVAQALADAASDQALATSGVDAATYATRLRHSARALATARPSMAALATTVARICAAGWPSGATGPEPQDPTAARAAVAHVRAESERVLAAWDTAAHAIAGYARPLLRGVVFTLSRSGTVEQALTTLAGAASALTGVIVAESRPGSEGVVLARALAAAGLPVTLVADAAIGATIADADCVALGADSVRADDSLVNKVGSYPLALAAHAAGVPVYILCETMKVAPEGWPLVLEEMDPAELLPEPVAGISVRNVYFDHTPAEYVSAIVTERGALQPSQVRALAQQAARELAALDEG